MDTEAIGSLPRPDWLLKDRSEENQRRAIQETLQKIEELGESVLTDGEQTKSSFVTYPLDGLDNLSSDGVVIPFKDGHTRQLPRLTKGPFRYAHYAVEFYREAKKHTTKPLKQAVIAPSALSLLYPPEGIPDYSREQFIDDLKNDAEKDIRQLLEAGAKKVQLDFTEGRLSLKIDHSGSILQSFIDLNNAVLDRFTDEEKGRLGVHSCPGADWDSDHSSDIPYSIFLPELFKLHVNNFYLTYKAEPNKKEVLELIQKYRPEKAKVFLGVTDVLSKNVETPEEVQNLLEEALQYIPKEYLGSTDDCGFSPFCDDISTSRELVFAKISARIQGTQLLK